ncbi:Ig-like domain-containing protein [Stutzerimonas kunmingensis]|uniref:Ig-like domain-containing protein n=1 Tax=Stutzerimonas kunmingensis TaxID=1211807 RepID=UPI0028AA9949|nr:Ig-like domain-containing protein [Stutzerimonas kunmingensis]
MNNQASVLFVDSRVQDRATLLAGLAPDVEVVLLDPDVDGLSQIATVLAGRSDISSIQVLSHGTEGMVQMGSLNLTSANVVTHAADLATIGNALTADGDILLYGCNAGAGTDGEALVQSLAKLTGADVAASSDLTGAANQGGNWNLEVQAGPIEVVLPFDAQVLADYQDVLATGTALETTTSGNYDSAQGITLLNNGGHADLYLHQISGDNSYNGAPPQYAAKVVVADASNNIIDTLTVSGSDYVLNASLAKLANGGFVVAWSADTSVDHDYSDFGVFYQVYDNAGVAQGTTQPLSSKAGQYVSLTSLADGGFAAAFYTEDQTLTLGIYDESNATLSLTNETTMGGNSIRYSSAEDHDVLYKFSNGAGPSIVQLADKSIVVTDSVYVYYSPTSTPLGDYAFKFDSTGTPVNFASGYSSQRLNWSVTAGAGGNEDGEHAIALSGGGFAVVSLNNYGGTQQYELMLFNSDGTPVNSSDTLTQNGSYDGVNASKTIYAKQIVASVSPGDNAWLVPGAARFSLAESSDGKILVALPKSDMSGVNIYTYTSSGVAVSGPVDSGITVSEGQWIGHPVIVPAANGGFAITYDALSVDSETYVISGTAYSYGIPYSAIPAPAAPALSLSPASDTGIIGDGITSVKVPEIKGTGAIGATVSLYADGTTVLGTAVVDSAGNWTITSSTLADGTHALTAKQTSGSQTSAASTVLSLNVDSAAPTTPSAPTLDSASDSGTSTTDGITNIHTPVITGTTEANSTVRLYDTDGTTLLGTGTADGSGTYSIATSMLASGTHLITIKATDAAGNTSPASSGLTVNIDMSAPTGITLSSSSINSMAAIHGATLATLSSTDVDSVNYGLATGDTTNDADNAKFSISNGNLIAAQNLTAGTYHIYLKASDAAGNDAFQAFTISVIDSPAVSSIVRETGAAVDHAAPSVNYIVTFSQAVTGVNLSDFTLSSTGTATGTIAGITTNDNITYTVNINSLTGDGTLRLDLNSSGTGIQNGSSVEIAGGFTSGQTYVLDHTAPLAPTLALSPGSDSGDSNTDGITSNPTPIFTGTAEANSIVRLYDTDGTTVLGTVTADGSGAWSITSSTLSGGAHTVTARAFDAVGNLSSASAAKSVTIDTAAPVAPTALALATSSDTGVPGDGITNLGLPIITGAAEANSKVTLFDTDGITALGTASADGSGAWSITSSMLASGTHVLTAKAVDAAGNGSGASTSLSVTIQNTAPAAPADVILAPASDTGTLGDGITYANRPIITGTAEANSKVTLFDTDGITILGVGTTNDLGAWSITSNDLSLGNHSLTVKQEDVAGNVSDASSALVLSIVAVPVTPTVPTAPTLVDGVPVTSTPVTLPGGGTGTAVFIPVVSDSQGSTLGNPDVADIPLITVNGAALLTSQVPTGTGLTSIGGTSKPAGSSLETLIAAIKAQTTTHAPIDQNHLTGSGADFLTLLSTTAPVLVNTVIVQNTLATSSTPLTLTGTSSTSQHTALVVDTSALASKSSIVLDKVDFAAMVGSVSVTSSTAGQILTGDAASQTFILANSTPSQVFAGGGNDQLHYGLGSTGTSSGAGTASVNNINIIHENPLSTATSVYLNAGAGSDVAVFTKAQSAYNIDQHDGYVLVTDKADPSQQITITNTETITFNDGEVAVQSRDELTTLAGLYQVVLGRQADIGGFEYWGALQSNGASLGTITVNMLRNSESIARGFGLNGDASHDVDVLYQAVFGRAADAAGKAYWVDELNNGSTISDVANGFVTSLEMTGHKLMTTDWDLHF